MASKLSYGALLLLALQTSKFVQATHPHDSTPAQNATGEFSLTTEGQFDGTSSTQTSTSTTTTVSPTNLAHQDIQKEEPQEVNSNTQSFNPSSQPIPGKKTYCPRACPSGQVFHPDQYFYECQCIPLEPSEFQCMMMCPEGQYMHPNYGCRCANEVTVADGNAQKKKCEKRMGKKGKGKSWWGGKKDRKFKKRDNDDDSDESDDSDYSYGRDTYKKGYDSDEDSYGRRGKKGRYSKNEDYDDSDDSADSDDECDGSYKRSGKKGRKGKGGGFFKDFVINAIITAWFLMIIKMIKKF